MNRAARGFDVASLAVLGGAAALTFALYDRLPARVPTHFDLSGNANGWMDRAAGAWVVPAIAIATWAVVRFARVWAPGAWRERVEKSPMSAAAFTTATLLGGVQAIILWASLHPGESTGRALGLVLGPFLLAQALVLPRVRRNPILGVRTAWTLTSDENWARTHRVASYTFAAGGIAALACATAGGPPAVAIFAVLASALLPWGYSYVLARQLPHAD